LLPAFAKPEKLRGVLFKISGFTSSRKARLLEVLHPFFFKTELELGHCLVLPQEGPCECELYLNCPKFGVSLLRA
jgi:hypothetical protein